MRIEDITQRIRARLSETGHTPIGVAVQAGLPRDAIRSVLRGHPPNLLRADEICRALGITLTIGAGRARARSVNESSNSLTADSPTVSHDGPRAEYFAHVVDPRLADLFEGIAETYEIARTHGERDLVFHMLNDHATSIKKWFTSFVKSGEPPIEQAIPLGDETDHP